MQRRKARKSGFFGKVRQLFSSFVGEEEEENGYSDSEAQEVSLPCSVGLAVLTLEETAHSGTEAHKH